MEPSEPPRAELTDRETWRAYYLLQYERVAHHENARLQISSFVLAGSVVALGLTTADHLTTAARSALGAVLAINLLAALYAALTRKSITAHVARARMTLRYLDPVLHLLHRGEVGPPSTAFQEQASTLPTGRERRLTPMPRFRMEVMLIGMHLVVSTVALISVLR